MPYIVNDCSEEYWKLSWKRNVYGLRVENCWKSAYMNVRIYMCSVQMLVPVSYLMYTEWCY